jgi:UDP-2,3-diacylglucosamine hydrolase
MGGISIISDIHVGNPGDEQHDLLIKFMQHPVVNVSSDIFFLGDVFDLMVGGFKEYQKKFPIFFKELERLLAKNINIHYIEGNHDFHAAMLFDHSIPKKLKKYFFYYQHGAKKNYWNKCYYFCHGDELDLGDIGHKIYTKIIRSQTIDYLVNNVLPYSVISGVGEWASSRSRGLNSDRYTNPARQSGTKALFRQAVNKQVLAIGCDYYVCGHSHVKDQWELPTGIYANNGYAPIEKSFIQIENNQISFLDILSS